MGIFSAIGRMFSGSPKESITQVQPPAPSFRPEDWTIECVRKQGINPMVRNADDDYHAVSTNYTAANRLARDCAR